MYRGTIVGCLTTILALSNANAEDNTCVELAKIIGANYSSYLSRDEQRAVHKADMCSQMYSSASNGL